MSEAMCVLGDLQEVVDRIVTKLYLDGCSCVYLAGEKVIDGTDFGLAGAGCLQDREANCEGSESRTGTDGLAWGQ